MKVLENFTSEQLLIELIGRNKTQEAPRKIQLAEGHSVCTLPVGRDFHAEVIIDNEALSELNGHSRLNSSMSFSEALAELRSGKKVARLGWNGRGMYLTKIPAGNACFQGFQMQDCIGMKTAKGEMQPGWLASQADMLSDDWMVVD